MSQQQQRSIPSYLRTQEQDAASLGYMAFIDQIAGPDGPRHFREFAALRDFIHLDGFPQHGIPPCVGKPIITVATLMPNTTAFEFQNVETHELGSIIDPDVLQLFLVENVTPELVKVLGGHLEIDPQFFLDYLDAIPGEFNITKEGEDIARPDLVPTPWYRLQSLEGHLPMLRSSRAGCEHIRMRFVGPRQCRRPHADNRRHAKERMRPDLQRMNVERVAGLQIPIARDTGVGGRQFDNVAMTRQCASVWFKTPADPKKPEWLKGLVLLDPPFDHSSQKEYGEMMLSMHRTCLAYLAPFDLKQQDRDLLDGRSSYRESLVRYLQTLSLNTSDFHPLLLVRGVAQIVASEWIVTNVNVERDINTVEWQLETMSAAAAADVAVLQRVLSRLFTHRRRIARYRALVEEQRELFSEQGGGSIGTMPAAWWSGPAGCRRLPKAASKALRNMQTDASQAYDLVTRNAERIAQLMELLMSVMSVREAGLSTRFGPEGESFWVFWVGSLCTWALVWSIYLLYPRLRRRNVTREV
ncbi:hypothetical protein N658DRAFT_490633 [Parathielavia hyrcaniae]|uniref:Uncharacterized protein n=1 Tax=Parathielavia hyrcaniae TaxID=113614 RepID=A0AAN6T6M7_9PEZI|nr:hypothetical protein N658DRAFT_490633 [Parathielavia hyrcaniae]